MKQGMLFASAAMSVVLLSGSYAIAQESEGASASKSDGFLLEEIIVTARKREESMQDAPVSVSAHSGQSLALRQIDSADKLAMVTPNLTFDANAPSSGHGSAAQIFIRGIGQSEFLASSEPGVGMYIDDVYIARSIGSVVDFIDVERVEVLRGPQGTLFGRNTIGGAIVIHSKKPSYEPEGEVQVKVGTDNLLQSKLRVSGPLSETLAASLTLGQKRRDGYVTRLNTGEDLGDDKDFNARLGLLWTPRSDLEILLNADYTHEDENGAPLVLGDINSSAAFPILASLFAGCPGSTPPGPGAAVPDLDDPRCANTNQIPGMYATNGTGPVESTLEVWGVGLTVDWDVSDNLTMKSITSYRAMENSALRDADGTPLTILHTSNYDDQWQFSQEVQFSGASFDSKLDWLLGFYYFDERNENQTSPTLTVTQLQLDGIAETDTKAVFGQATYHMTDKLSITGGLRWTEENKAFTPDQIVLTNFPTPGGVIPAGTLIVPADESKQSISRFTPMANISYAWSDDVSTYVSYSEGFKSGGYNARNVTPLAELPTFGPEFAKTFEFGLKSMLLDRRLRLNASLFTTDYTDLQITFRSGIAPVLVNSGKAKIQGVEIEGSFVPNSDWLIDFGMGYIDASYGEITDPGPQFNATVTPDSRFAQTPKFAGNLGISYNKSIGSWVLIPRVDMSHTGSKFFDAPNSPQLYQDAVTIFNASLALEDVDEKWRFVLAVNNLTNEEYLVGGTSSFDTATGYVEHVYSRGRQWSFTAQYRW